jgi:hypothetical protein
VGTKGKAAHPRFLLGLMPISNWICPIKLTNVLILTMPFELSTAELHNHIQSHLHPDMMELATDADLHLITDYANTYPWLVACQFLDTSDVAIGQSTSCLSRLGTENFAPSDLIFVQITNRHPYI